MRHRGYFRKEERETRSRLAKTVHREPFLQGSIVKTYSRCGNNNCWCANAEKGHRKCYLSIRVGSKRKMIYVPTAHEKQVYEWVRTYKEISKGVAIISKNCLDRIKRN